MNLKQLKKLTQTNIYWILLAIVIIFIAYIRIRISSTPFERDEGEYAYMGQLLLRGIPPFKEAFNMKLPGTSIVYAFFMLLFGETVTAIHLGLLITNILSIVIVFILAKKWLDSAAGIVAAVVFALLTLNFSLLGFAAHATHFIVLFALAGLWTLIIGIERQQQKWFWTSGLLLGCAFLMKQPGVFFFFLALAVLIFYPSKRKIKQKKLIRFGLSVTAGFLIPLTLVIAIIIICGTFQKFWFWIVQYAFAYGNSLTFNEGRHSFARTIGEFWFFIPWLCFPVITGFILLCLGRFSRYVTIMLSLFLLFSILGVLPGWHFREHYFILAIPACSILVASAFNYFYQLLKHRPKLKYLPLLFLLFIIGQNIYSNNIYYFSSSPEKIIRFTYGNNFFDEYIPISNFISAHTAADDRIAVVGSEPQIYFYTKRLSASGHIYMYGMMEPQPYARKMQDEFISDVERVKPKYMVFAEVAFSWLGRTTSDMHIIEWFANYSKKYYKRVCIVDLIRSDNVQYVWGEEAQTYVPIAKNIIFVFERID